MLATMVIAGINVGVLYVFAVSSLGVYGIVLAGWASNSKYPFLGGIRSSSQMISYELALGLSVIPIFLLCGTLSLPDIVLWQRNRIAPNLRDLRLRSQSVSLKTAWRKMSA